MPRMFYDKVGVGMKDDRYTTKRIVEGEEMRFTPYWWVTYEEFAFGWFQIYILLAIWGIE